MLEGPYTSFVLCSKTIHDLHNCNASMGLVVWAHIFPGFVQGQTSKTDNKELASFPNDFPLLAMLRDFTPKQYQAEH